MHLIPSDEDEPTDPDEAVNVNVFKNLDSPVSEAGENFSAGEKQLIWYGSIYDSMHLLSRV